MIVGPGRIKIPRASSSNEGLVVEAVLVMALVTTIGVLITAARVAGSRQSSASASTSQAARQAAEYGYSEILAEMNRDSKSYLWVTKFSQWSNVSAQDLKTCGVASSADPSADPIPGLTSNNPLSNSPGLSYMLTDYKEPIILTPPSSGPAVCGTKFANLNGGTAVLTIVGTAENGSGYTSTYTMKRTVSVNRTAPIFNNPVTAPPPNRIFDAADSRFPVYADAANPAQVAYPGKPSGTYFEIICEPNSASTIKCTADPDSKSASLLSANFKSATASGSGNDDFPYLANGDLWDPCQPVGANVRCLIKSLTVKANANMLVATKRGTIDAPVEIFLSESMTIEPDAKLSGDESGDGKSWSRFRIFGVTSGASCGSQTITINSFTDSVPTPPQVQPNLQNAFLWLSQGKLKYDNLTSLDRIPALVGSVCLFESPVAAPAYLSSLSNRGFLDGLGAAYGYQGGFGGAAPIRFFYRGFGFTEQRLSS